MALVRLEICHLNGLTVPTILAGATLKLSDQMTPAAAQPVAPMRDREGEFYVRAEALDLPAYVAVGSAPDPTREPRMLVLPRRLGNGWTEMRLRAGERVAAILAEDVPWPT